MNTSTANVQHTENTVSISNAKSLLVRMHDIGETWLKRQKTRRQLAQMPAYLLRDVGLTEADRYSESRKHFWQN
ncbi:DUF1127 domain-containing protein [Alginatibacterium sediminis]|nr:DUF1127 domain-containing protein [Alginatibacterium sediminis]